MTWENLAARVAARGDQTFVVQGVGARARKLVTRLGRELPQVFVSQRGREHFAFVNPTRPIAWRAPDADGTPVQP